MGLLVISFGGTIFVVGDCLSVEVLLGSSEEVISVFRTVFVVFVGWRLPCVSFVLVCFFEVRVAVVEVFSFGGKLDIMLQLFSGGVVAYSERCFFSIVFVFVASVKSLAFVEYVFATGEFACTVLDTRVGKSSVG